MSREHNQYLNIRKNNSFIDEELVQALVILKRTKMYLKNVDTAKNHEV